MEVVIEVGDFPVPLDIALRHLIKLVLHLGREVIVHDSGEILHQKVINHHTHIGGNEFTFLHAEDFRLLAFSDLTALQGNNLIFPLVALVLAFFDILPLLNSGNNRRIG